MFENKIYWDMKLNLDETVDETLMVLALSF